MLRIAIACVVAALAAGITVNAAAQGAARADDRAAIEALMWRYVRALDTFNADAYAAVFTEDGRFGAGPNATVGRDALRQMVSNLAANRNESSPPMYHMIANSYVEFVGEDRALMHSYWLTVFGAAGQGTTPRVAAAGRGVDELVRVNGQWLIHSRNVAPQD
jgi:uncharacterized protein (TIGR02246 family)